MFKVITDKYYPVAIYFIVLGLNLYTVFVYKCAVTLYDFFPTFAIFFSSFAVVYAYTKTKKDPSKVQINVNLDSIDNTCISTKNYVLNFIIWELP